MSCGYCEMNNVFFSLLVYFGSSESSSNKKLGTLSCDLKMCYKAQAKQKSVLAAYLSITFRYPLGCQDNINDGERV